MKNLLYKIRYIYLFTFVIVVGCTKEFDKINTDPDALDKVPPQNMLTNVLRNAGEEFGGDVDGYGTFAGYIVKIQYLDRLDGLTPSNNTYGNRWYACYYNITQLNDLLSKTQEKTEAYKNVRTIARIWQNYMWSYLLDGWGDIPYTEAFKGLPADGEILRPKYDKEQDIFPAVLGDLKKIADEMAAGIGTDEVGNFDVIYWKSGISIKDHMLLWQKFCNSLRLRMAMRISAVAPALAKSTIEEIAGDKSKYPVLESSKENCYLYYPGTLPYMEPWYKSGINGARIDNWGMFDIFINYLKEVEDPRLSAIADTTNVGTYVGFPNGPESGGPKVLKSVSWIGGDYINNPAGYTPFYKSCETYYILAEAAMLGYNVKMTAKEAYEKAVMISMEDNGVAMADAKAYLANAGEFNNTKERIWWDMWTALFKENYEAWALYRRTGVPTTNYPVLNSRWGTAHNDQPWRLPYPNNEYLYNKVNTEAAASGVVDHVWGKRLWWAKDNGKE